MIKVNRRDSSPGGFHPSSIIHLYRLSKYAIFVSILARNVFFAGFAIGNSKIIATFASVVVF
jgi:hypothetical protein